MNASLPAGYALRRSSSLDSLPVTLRERALLVRFIQRTYAELFPGQPLMHLARTVDAYLSPETPVWWVIAPDADIVAGLWLGNAIDQVQGDRHAHIFLLYVSPAHRRRGIGTFLMQYAEDWAQQRGDRQVGLQVFQSNQPALDLYGKLGYEVQSLWMVKAIGDNRSLSPPD